MSGLGTKLMELCRLSRRLLMRRIAGESQRTWVQLRTLQAIAEEDVRTQASLAECLMIDAPQASRVVSRLEADGLLERCAGTDRRCVRMSVTPAADEELLVLRRSLAWLDSETCGVLSVDERQTFSLLLDKVYDRLRERAGSDDDDRHDG